MPARSGAPAYSNSATLRRTSSARIALRFYAGHGVAIDGRNYLVPIDTKEINRATVNFELVDVDRILAGLDDEARANIVLLDACRDNPLEARGASGRAMGRGSGLAPYGTVASGMLIAFATAPGRTAATAEVPSLRGLLSGSPPRAVNPQAALPGGTRRRWRRARATCHPSR